MRDMRGMDVKIAVVLFLSIVFLGASCLAFSRSLVAVKEGDIVTLVAQNGRLTLVFREREGRWLKGIAHAAWGKVLDFATAHNPAGDTIPDWLDDKARAWVKAAVN
ncbi:MAG TPA: hypothetical protein PKA31_00575 [Candidatus Moranbacteria bacterium]|nr:hypothetical protein [Candidatus Moranbacteria bacterium]